MFDKFIKCFRLRPNCNSQRFDSDLQPVAVCRPLTLSLALSLCTVLRTKDTKITCGTFKAAFMSVFAHLGAAAWAQTTTLKVFIKLLLRRMGFHLYQYYYWFFIDSLLIPFAFPDQFHLWKSCTLPLVFTYNPAPSVSLLSPPVWNWMAQSLQAVADFLLLILSNIKYSVH